MSRFNSVCFFFVLLLQIRNPTIYVFPLTMMVLLWGSLSLPRPSKLFWKTIFSYTMVRILYYTSYSKTDSGKEDELFWIRSSYNSSCLKCCTYTHITVNLEYNFQILVLFDSLMRSSLISNDSTLISGNNTLRINPFFTVEKQENFSIYYLFILLTVLWQRCDYYLRTYRIGQNDLEELSNSLSWFESLQVYVDEFGFMGR